MEAGTLSYVPLRDCNSSHKDVRSNTGVHSNGHLWARDSLRYFVSGPATVRLCTTTGELVVPCRRFSFGDFSSQGCDQLLFYMWYLFEDVVLYSL